MPQQSNAFTTLLYLVVPLAIFYFLLLRPQQAQQKKRRELLEALKTGDRVVTIGGIHGTINEIDDKVVKLQIAEKVEIQINRSAIGAQAKTES